MKDKHNHSAHDMLGKASKTLAAVAVAGSLTVGTDLIKDSASSAFGITAQAAEVGKGTTTENLNLRKGPGTGNAIIKVLPKGTKLSITEKAGDWLKVSVNGQEGWGSADYVSQGTSSATTAPSAPAKQATGSGTTIENLNLRKGAGTQNAVIKVLPKGTKLEILAS